MLKYILKIRIKTAIVWGVGIISVISILLYLTVLFHNEGNDTSQLPLLMWWTPFILEDQKIINCGNEFQCVVTKNRTKIKQNPNLAAYLFYGSNFDYYDLPLPKVQTPWAIFHEESPKNLPLLLNYLGQRLFNISSTFNRNSDFPLPLQYLRNLDGILDTTNYIPVAEKNKLLETISPVLYIQTDCDTPIERDSIVRELMEYVRVDSYGKCLNNKKLPEEYSIDKVFLNLYDSDFVKFVARYKFTIAIENAICEDYVTEKLWRPLVAGSLPIYLGSPSVQDWLPNNNSAILIQNFKNISHLAEYINKVHKNDELYNQHMQHKIKKEVTNLFLIKELEKGEYGLKYGQEFDVPAFECFVCEAVHKNSYRKHNKSVFDCKTPTSRDRNSPNWWETHWLMGKCQAKALNHFLNVLHLANYTKKMFNDQYEEYLNNGNC